MFLLLFLLVVDSVVHCAAHCGDGELFTIEQNQLPHKTNNSEPCVSESKVTGLDGTSARLLKHVFSTISALLTAILNCSISTTTVPEKHARVVRLHENGDRKSVEFAAPCLSCRLCKKFQRNFCLFSCRMNRFKHSFFPFYTNVFNS